MTEDSNNPKLIEYSHEELQRWTEHHNSLAAELLTPEARQVADLFNAYSYLDALLKENGPFGEDTILSFHRIAARNIPDIHPHVGKYFLRPRRVISTVPWEIKPFAPVEEREKLMREVGLDYASYMTDSYQTPDGAIRAVTRGAEMIARICDIHPFLDGNGRVSRIVADSIFLRAGLSQVPFWAPEGKLHIPGGKNHLHKSVEQARTGNPNPLVHFLAEQQAYALTTRLSDIRSNPTAYEQAKEKGVIESREGLLAQLQALQDKTAGDLEK